MSLEQKLHEELLRHKAINNYGKKMIMEQDVPPPPPGGDVPPPPGGDVPPPPGDAGALPPAGAPADAGATPAPETTEEIDITDLVNMTKNIKKEIDDNKGDHTNVLNKMEDVFTKLGDLESKLGEMDKLIQKIDQLGSKVESMKAPTAVEKLEMRSLDSYPFSQNPQQFFNQKQDQMKASGKNEYVLTKDDIENYSKDTIRNSFNANPDEFGI